MRVLSHLHRWCRMLWADVVWEVAEAMGREERAGYEEDRYFVEALAADPRREEPQVLARGPRHASDEEADHTKNGYDTSDGHRGRHRHWYDDEEHLSAWSSS